MKLTTKAEASPGGEYEIVIDGITHKAIKLEVEAIGNRRLSEVQMAKLAFERNTGAFNRQGGAVSFFDNRDYEYFELGCEIAKLQHEKPFGGENPRSAEYGVRRLRLSDVMGGTAAGLTAGGNDRAWGACTTGSAVYGNQVWTAARREWLGDGSQSGDADEFVQNEATFDACGLVKTQEVASAGNDFWTAMIIGIKSFAAQPIVETVLAEYVGTKIPDWDVGALLREGAGHAVKRAQPYIFTKDSGFKLGFRIEFAAPDQVEPLGWSWPTYERMRQTTITYCRVATA